MRVVKFVTEDLKSPSNHEQLDYSNFGIPIKVNADLSCYGQCARGIHVIPISEDADLKNVIFTGTMILLEVEEEDIVYCEGNGKMRVSKATPVRQVKKSDKEWKIIRTAVLKGSKYAYEYAWRVDKKPTNETRKAACQDPEWAYWYAKDVDQKSTEETRIGACRDAGYAYLYALDVDKGPTEKTRIAACKEPHFAYVYAKDVDKKPTKETRTAACNDVIYAYIYAYMYARDIDKKPTSETRIAAYKKLKFAYLYARDVDKVFIFNYMKKIINELFMKIKGL